MEIIKNIGLVWAYKKSKGLSPAIDFLVYFIPVLLGFVGIMAMGGWWWLVGGILVGVIMMLVSLHIESRLGKIIRENGVVAFEKELDRLFGFDSESK